jgi:hypothetical protein
MYKKISALAETLQAFVNKTKYVFEIFTWAVASLRSVADILSSFPKPDNYEADQRDSTNSSRERTAEAELSNGEQPSGDKVREPNQ